jgi:hypothetical protein
MIMCSLDDTQEQIVLIGSEVLTGANISVLVSGL